MLGFHSADSSSASKGESVSDTIRVISCYADICAMRHPKEGAPLVASEKSRIPPPSTAGRNTSKPAAKASSMPSAARCARPTISMSPTWSMKSMTLTVTPPPAASPTSASPMRPARPHGEPASTAIPSPPPSRPSSPPSTAWTGSARRFLPKGTRPYRLHF